MSKTHNTEASILVFLLNNKNKDLTIRKIAKSIKRDYKSVYMAVKQLKDVLQSKKVGQTVLCAIKKTFHPDIINAESIRKEDLLKNKDFYVLHENIKRNVKSPFFILLLFGSYASGKAKKSSDIDLMLITDDKEASNQIKHQISLLPLKTHLSIFKAAEFLSMIKTTDFNVGKEALNNNIILFGIENYYRLIENA